MLFKISAIRLPAKTNNVPIITIARSSGVSLLSPASVRVDPSPGYEKTCSARTDPPNNYPK